MLPVCWIPTQYTINNTTQKNINVDIANSLFAVNLNFLNLIFDVHSNLKITQLRGQPVSEMSIPKFLIS